MSKVKVIPCEIGGGFGLPRFPENAMAERSEKLNNGGQNLGYDVDPGTAKKKVVSTDSLCESLTTFRDLYVVATPEERREQLRLRINQLVWTPDEIKLALFDERQEAVSKVQRVASTGSPDVGFIEHWPSLGSKTRCKRRGSSVVTAPVFSFSRDRSRRFRQALDRR